MSVSALSATRIRVGHFSKILICVAIVGPVFYLLQHHIAQMDKAALADALRAISLQSIAISALFSAISLYAVARYDRLAMRQMGMNVTDKTSVQGGFAAVSIGQTLGFGLLVSSAVRWRFYRHTGVTLPQAAMISAMVMAGFLVGFIAILSVAVLISAESLTLLTGLDAGTMRAFAGIALLGLAAFAVASVLQPKIGLFGRYLPIPGFRVLRAQIALAALDVIPAAIALWVLIPGEAGPTLMALIPVYLVALGIGLVSNAPGGLGVLELACLMALPVYPPELLLAALIAHRAIYYGVPALIATAMLVARELQYTSNTTPQAADMDGILANSGKAEATLVYLGDKSILTADCGTAMVQFGNSGNSLVVLGDPIGAPATHAQMMADVMAQAKASHRAPVFYKASKALRDMAKDHGLISAQIGMDAIVDPRNFTTAGSSFRELRRKLRNAEKAGVDMLIHSPGTAPLARLEPVSQAWSAAKGGERGFSMGHFCKNYLARQPIIEARIQGLTVGFLSLMVSGDGSEMCLDVMRLTDAAPDGTMHALVASGIEFAAAAGSVRFSLAAVPFAGLDEPKNLIERGLQTIFEKKRDWHGSHGLLRFKNAFRPEWEPLFVLAPTQWDAALGLWDAKCLIHAVSPHVTAVDPAEDAMPAPAMLAA